MQKSETPTGKGDLRTALMNRLADRVREVRKQKGLPRRIVSERSGVSPRYLAQLEAGEGNISIALLERVARALGVPIQSLVANPVNMISPEAEHMALLYENASADVRAKVNTLLNVEWPLQRPRAGWICLTGLRGAGKTTLGKLAGKSLGLPFVELSSLIEEETGMPLAKVMSLYGINGYRRLEAEALERVVKLPGPILLSVSGGLVEQKALYARLLEHFHTIWLRATPAEHVERVRAQGYFRLIKDNRLFTEKVKALMENREPLYAKAEVEFDTSGRSTDSALRGLISLITKKEFLKDQIE